MTSPQIPRVALLWLLVSVWASLLMHSSYLPLWLWGLLAGVAAWRWLTHMGRLPYPNGWVKALAVTAASIGVILTFSKQFSLESAASFLVAASLLKLLEMKHRRDGYIVVMLSYFLLATGFLFDQGIAAGSLGVLTTWLTTTAMVTLHQNHNLKGDHRRSLRLSGALLLSALPMMLVMYLLFPRFGPLWAMPLQSSQARTGLSNEMAPGDIANLSQSDELVFMASFVNDQPPPAEKRYWRALVLDRYKGRTWMAGDAVSTFWYPNSWQPPEGREGVLTYDIIQEATGKTWLFALRGVAAVENNIGMTADDRLVHRDPLYQRIRYRAKSWLDVSLNEEGLTRLERALNTRLPEGVNPRARQWAARLKSSSRSDEAFIQTIWQHFRTQPYFYTLKPPALGSNDIDEFLFDTRRGFCAHYSGALVFLARSAGIPARVVAGYQGGEWNEEYQYLAVRQYDAHAWAEVWYPDKGWTRVDPTAAVSPTRIESGLEAAVKEEGSFLQDQLFSTHKLKQIGWLNSLRMQLDSLNYYWQRWVLSYDNQTQQQLLKGILGLQSYEKILYLLAGSFAVFFVIAAVFVWWGQRPEPASVFMRHWRALEQKARRSGVTIQVGETHSDVIQHWIEKCPDHAVLLNWLDKMLTAYLYLSEDSISDNDICKAMRLVRKKLP